MWLIRILLGVLITAPIIYCLQCKQDMPVFVAIAYNSLQNMDLLQEHASQQEQVLSTAFTELSTFSIFKLPSYQLGVRFLQQPLYLRTT